MRVPPEALPSAYDRFPATHLDATHPVWVGAAVWAEVTREAAARAAAVRERSVRAVAVPPVIVIDTYPGVEVDTMEQVLAAALPEYRVVNVERTAKSPEALDTMLARFLTDDRVFGVVGNVSIDEFYDPDAVAALRADLRATRVPTVVIGWGATRCVTDPTLVVLADLARWEAELRQRRGASNWRAGNPTEDSIRKYKRAYFVEWRTADAHKRPLLGSCDYLLDTNAGTANPKLITGDTFRAALAATAQRPFRTVPFFDPGIWGGQWMKSVCNLDPEPANYAWSFDGVPEANSLLIAVGDERIEIPSIDVVYAHPRELLGERTFARFGAEFPIRFDFLDTMDGANLSLQVHPLTDYMQRTFGMHYTQDESYYLLDAGDDACVYLGLRSDIDPQAMLDDLAAASRGERSFPAEEHVNVFPARRHDHFLIPAGTVHCSGANAMVLEISATPFIFTFKMWDWDRVGLDGVPRPIHLDHARANIQWNRRTEWVRDTLVNQVVEVARGDTWVEERTGLHELEFIETRRHWFTGPVPHDTRGTVRVHNLVAGREAIVESPTGAFPPFVVHYAETFIVPAAVGPYVIRPHGPSVGSGERLATLTAYVRGTERDLLAPLTSATPDFSRWSVTVPADRSFSSACLTADGARSTASAAPAVPVLDIGGTHVTAALVASDGGEILNHARYALEGTWSAERLLEAFVTAARAVDTEAKWWSVAMPGPFDYAAGIGRFTGVAKFDSLDGVDVGASLRADLGADVCFLNDADAFGIGECRAGAGVGYTRVLVLALGTGLGSTFIVDGNPVHTGPSVPDGGYLFTEQFRGDPVETHISRRAIIAAYHERSGLTLDVRDIADAARAGDPVAHAAFSGVMHALGTFVAPWLTRFAADALVIGGSIAGSWDLVAPATADGIASVSPELARCPILHATLGNDAPLIGAALYGRAHFAA